jgi:hypothetical protein
LRASQVNFTGDDDSAIIFIDDLLLTDTTRDRGFTHVIRGDIFGGTDYGAAIEIGNNDYCLIDSPYMGRTVRHIRIRPSSNDANIVGTWISMAYPDGVLPSNGSLCIDIDGASTTGTIRDVNVIGGTVGQCDRGIWLHGGADPRQLNVIGVQFQNIVKNAIKTQVNAAQEFDLKVHSCTFDAWHYSNDQVSPETYAIAADRGRIIDIQGNTLRAREGFTQPAIYAVNIEEALIIQGNIGFDLSQNHNFSTNGGEYRILAPRS